MVDTLINDLDSANKGEIPSPFGRTQFIVKGSPVSVQTNKTTKKNYLNRIRANFSDLKYILTGEILLNITWQLSAKHRFETDAKSDIDNCLKPMIDAFTGPQGFFIDDCQLKGLYICWQHIESGDEQVIFDFEFMGDQYCYKEDLAFIKLKGGLCVPVNLNWPRYVKIIFASHLAFCQKQKNILEKLGINYLYVAGFLAGNQPFHITRVQEFQILSLQEFVFTPQLG